MGLFKGVKARTYLSKRVLVGTWISHKALRVSQALNVVFVGSDVVAGVKLLGACNIRDSKEREVEEIVQRKWREREP